MTEVLVPATSANLGPGFDCLGLAVGLYLKVGMQPSERDEFIYKGRDPLPNTADNLVHRGFRAIHQALDQTAPPVRFEVDNPIPLARGLGSSSAALVAGAALAAEGLSAQGLAFGREEVLQVTAHIEGHPDNVAPAVLGGFTVSTLRKDDTYLSRSLDFPTDWQLLFAVPSFRLLTRDARRVLPEVYSRRDAIFNASRTALWTAAVTLNEPDLLLEASRDTLHEPYREPLIPGLRACRKALAEAGIASYLSGAGPSLAAVLTDPRLKEKCTSLMRDFVGADGTILQLEPSAGYSLNRTQEEVASTD